MGVGDVVHNYGSRNVGTPTTSDVVPLHVTGISSGRYDAGAVMSTDDGAAAVHPPVDLHSIAIDGTDLPVRTDDRGSTSPQTHLATGKGPVDGVGTPHPIVRVAIAESTAP